MLEVGRCQPPPIAQLLRAMTEIRWGQTEYLTEVHHKGLPVIFRLLRRSQQMQARNAPLADFFPSTPVEFLVRLFESLESVNGAKRNKHDLVVHEVAALRDDDEIGISGRDVLNGFRITGAVIGLELWHQTLWQ